MEGLTETVIGKKKAIFDTGTTAIVGDPASIKQFYKHLRDAKPMMDGRRYHGTWAVLLINTARRLIPISITVPCDFNISMSVYVGKKEVKISPDSFKLGTYNSGPDCIAGVEMDSGLTGGKLASGTTFLRTELTSV